MEFAFDGLLLGSLKDKMRLKISAEGRTTCAPKGPAAATGFLVWWATTGIRYMGVQLMTTKPLTINFAQSYRDIADKVGE
jgi:hypothetical protein